MASWSLQMSSCSSRSRISVWNTYTRQANPKTIQTEVPSFLLHTNNTQLTRKETNYLFQLGNFDIDVVPLSA